MDRSEVLKRIENSDRQELEAWKRHVLRCREHFIRDRNAFEVEECDFILGHIDRRLDALDPQRGMNQRD
ncbi:MAG: hypothetical protein QJR01_03135 [Kyrpidia sp.]|nr:hypothetical protein [Kyrpidia sp.]